MPMMKLADVPYQALIAYANEVMQLEVKPGTSKANIIERMKVVDDTIEEIEIIGFTDPVNPLPAEDGGAVAGDITSGHASTHYSRDPLVTVRIQTSPETGGDRPLPIGVNGDWIVCNRDVNVDLPYRFYEALVNCIATDMRQTMRQDGLGFNTTKRDLQGVQFSVVRPADPTAIAEFRKRTDSINAAPKKRWMAKKRQMREAEAA